MRLHLVFFIAFQIMACSSSPLNYSEIPLVRVAPTIHATTAKPSQNPEIKGLASWYGRKFHNRRTASGERFNMDTLTAAHRTLPFGSRIKIQSLDSGKSIIVRVNDRGPPSKKRLIDVSYKAAQALGIVKQGIARVKIQVL